MSETTPPSWQPQSEVVTPPPIVTEPESTAPVAKKGIWGMLAVIGLLIVKFGKVALASVQFLKLGALLQTGGTMLLTAWVYSVSLGWPFAVGFVFTILIHELGHVVAAWAYRVPVSAPMFIPGMGAMIWSKHPAPSATAEAVIAIAGPIAGTVAGLVCWAVFAVTGSPLFLGLAHVTFLMNLFNMIPVFPMDGGRVLGAVSKWFLIPGMLILGALFVTGVVRNPLILILLVMALPQVFFSFKSGRHLFDTAHQPSGVQKAAISASYVALSAFLAWSMSVTDTHVSTRKPSSQVPRLERSEPPTDLVR